MEKKRKKKGSVCTSNQFTARVGIMHISGICLWLWTLLFLYVSSGINLFGQGIKSYWLSPRWNGQTQRRYVWETGPFTQRRGHWAANNPRGSHWKNWQFTALLPRKGKHTNTPIPTVPPLAFCWNIRWYLLSWLHRWQIFNLHRFSCCQLARGQHERKMWPQKPSNSIAIQ